MVRRCFKKYYHRKINDEQYWGKVEIMSPDIYQHILWSSKSHFRSLSTALELICLCVDSQWQKIFGWWVVYLVGGYNGLWAHTSMYVCIASALDRRKVFWKELWYNRSIIYLPRYYSYFVSFQGVAFGLRFIQSKTPLGMYGIIRVLQADGSICFCWLP